MATIVLGYAATSLVGNATLTAAIGSGLFVAAGSYIDQQYLFPSLFGSKNQARPQRFMDLQIPTADPGDPRVIAFGSDGVRVPCHVLFFSTRSVPFSEPAPGKGDDRINGVNTYADAAVAVNDRKTQELTNLIADGKVIYFSTRNTVVMRSHRMTVVESSTDLVLTGLSYLDDDFSAYFQPDNIVLLSNFSPDANNGYYSVVSVAAPSGNTPSTMRIARKQGQNTVNGGAGTTSSPGIIERADHVIVGHDYSVGTFVRGTNEPDMMVTRLTTSTSMSLLDVFKVGDRVNVSGVRNNDLSPCLFNDIDWLVYNIQINNQTGSEQIFLIRVGRHSNAGLNAPLSAGPASDCMRIRHWSNSGASNVFKTGVTNPVVFFDGDADQTAPPLIDEAEDDVPGYRGVALVTIDDMMHSIFGNRMPIFEAVVRPDVVATFSDAIREIVKLGKLPNPDSAIDLSGASTEQLRGYYIRGPQPIVQSLQPLLIAKQMVTQERRDQMAVFQIENADVVGVAAEDLAARKSGGTSKSTLTIERVEDAQLPTAVGVSFVDSSRNYGRGYESYGLRNPASLAHDNRMEIDLRPLSLSRPQGRAVAARILRRAWINREVVSCDLPPSYAHLLENDLVTIGGVMGRDWVLRTVHVQVGTDWIVRVRGVVEDVSLEIANVGARGVAGTRPPRTTPVTVLVPHALDVPAVSELHVRDPGLYLCAAPTTDGWAGAVAYYSDDNVSWSLIGALQTPHVMGEATTALATGSTLTVDVTNTVTVSMFNGETLASVTLDDVGRGANWFLLGDEVLAFLTATLQSDGTYVLSNLVRGLRDTSDHMGTHAIGDRFVRWTAFGEHGIWWPFPDGWAGNGRRRYIKIVPAGGLLADVTAIDITPRAETARCFRPVNVAVTRASNNATITWDAVPRSPLAQMFQKVQLDERAEEYVVQVFSDSTFGTAVHQFRLTSANGVAVKRSLYYSAADQTAHGLTAGATLHMRIWQVGMAGDGNYTQVSL